MSSQHPITPPLELVEQRWNNSQSGGDFVQEFATFFARWGADQELDACLKWMGSFCATWTCGRRPEDVLRAARRPKPPSLKEQALIALYAVATGANDIREQHQDLDTIRRALEQLNDE